MNGYYSVFNATCKKIADCGSLRDAITLVTMRGEGHYYQYTPYPGDIIDISHNKQLPTHDIVVNMNNGVGGSWTTVESPKLNENQQQPFN